MRRTDRNQKPECARCRARESDVWCCSHQIALCRGCTMEHENEASRREGFRSCYWAAAVPLRLMRSEQLPLFFPVPNPES